MMDDMVGSPGTQATWPIASAAVDDSYRNRTTRRSKALKGTAQGVHQLVHPRSLAACPAHRASYRTSASLYLRHTNKKNTLRRRPVFKVHSDIFILRTCTSRPRQ